MARKHTERKLTLASLEEKFKDGELFSAKQGDIICHIHNKIEYIHWLITGSISFFLALQDGDPEGEVCRISEPFLPIGWNGLNPPGRHTKNIVVASEEALFYRVRLTDNEAFLASIPESSLQILVCRKQFALLKGAINKQRSVLPRHTKPSSRVHDRRYDKTVQTPDSIVELFKKSPFLEPFEDDELRLFANCCSRRDYNEGEHILMQDTRSNGLFILIDGHVSLQRFETNRTLSHWPITESGLIFGWPTLIGECDFCTATAIRASSTLFIPTEDIRRVLTAKQTLASRFYIRLNWLVDNHISTAFIRYLRLKSNTNQLTIRYFIENYQTQIGLSSKLHEIPHLLNHRTTKHRAFGILYDRCKNGSFRERRIASICLDLLEGERQEMRFVNQLQRVYRAVTEAPPTMPPEEVRRACAIEVKKLCSLMDTTIHGAENLPESSGHIFIYNHLLNPPYYTLNNNFQITLDSHFISSVILFDRYGEPGIRTVRVANSKEFAHQNYYDKLGYINVFTKDSGTFTAEQQLEAREAFFRKATSMLQQGSNLVISPEGTSFRTEDDIPGNFKPGAFSLALKTPNEPLIVPIALLNFDKRIQEGRKFCKILPPFRVSEHPLFHEAESLVDFVGKYRLVFKKELETMKRQAGINLSELNIH